MSVFSNKKNKFLNESGQTFVAIVLLMVIALTVGVAISTRFIKTLHGITGSDDSSKALHVAEAGIEKMLILSNDTLEDYITYGNCAENCILTIEDSNGHNLTATIELSYIGESTDPFVLELTPTSTKQVLLTGYGTNQNLSVCWDTSASIYASYIYDESGETKQDIYAYNPVSYSGDTNGFSNAVAAQGHANCFTYSAKATPRMLRIKSVYNTANVYVIPTAGQILPRQGILIESTGRFRSAVKKVSVVKSEATMPGIFDYALYQKSETDTLSN